MQVAIYRNGSSVSTPCVTSPPLAESHCSDKMAVRHTNDTAASLPQARREAAEGRSGVEDDRRFR
jgi:hypothetical protein